MFTQVDGDDEESFHQYINGTQVEDAVLSDFDAEELEADFASTLPPRFASPTNTSAMQREEETKNASNSGRGVENNDEGQQTNQQSSRSIPTSANLPASSALNGHSDLTESQNLVLSASQLLMRPLPSSDRLQEVDEEESNVGETAVALNILKLQMLQKFGIDDASNRLQEASPSKSAASLPTFRSSPLAKISDIPDTASNTSAPAQPIIRDETKAPDLPNQPHVLLVDAVDNAAVGNIEPVDTEMDIEKQDIEEGLPEQTVEIAQSNHTVAETRPELLEGHQDEHAEAVLPLNENSEIKKAEDEDDDDDDDDLINLRISQTQPQEMLVDEDNERPYSEQPLSPIRSPFQPVASAINSPAESDTQQDIDLAILSAEEIPTDTVIENQQQQSHEETLREEEDEDDDPAPNTAEPSLQAVESEDESVDLLRTGTVDTMQERQTMNPHRGNVDTSAISHSTLSTTLPVLPDDLEDDDEQPEKEPPTPERKVSLEWIEARVHTSGQDQIVHEDQPNVAEAFVQSSAHQQHQYKDPTASKLTVKKRPASLLNSLLVDLTMDNLDDKLDEENVDELEDEVEKKMAALLKLQEALKRRKDKGVPLTIKGTVEENVPSSSSVVKSAVKAKSGPSRLDIERKDEEEAEEEEDEDPLVVEARREKASRRFTTFLSGDVRSPPKQPAAEPNDPVTPGGSKFRRKMQSSTPKAKASPGDLDLFKEPSSNWADDKDLDFSSRHKAPHKLPTFVPRKKAAAIAREDSADNEETDTTTAKVPHRQVNTGKAANDKEKQIKEKYDDSEAEFSLSDTQEQSKLPQSASAQHRRGKLKKQRALQSDDDEQEEEPKKQSRPPKQKQNQQQRAFEPKLDPLVEEPSQQEHDAENKQPAVESVTREHSIIPAVFYTRIPSVWVEVWNSLELLGWTWKPGKGLVDFFYIKPGAKPQRPFVKGQDFFCSTDEVFRYLRETVRTSQRSAASVDAPPVAVSASSSSSVVTSSAIKTNRQGLVSAAKQQQEEAFQCRESEHEEYEMPNDIEFDETQPQLVDIRKAPWKDVWKILRSQGWEWDFGPAHMNYFYAPTFNYKRDVDAVLGVTKFENEDDVRKFIKKQLKENGPKADDFSMFYVSAKRSQSISTDSQQTDIVDGQWTLGSHRRKRDLVQAMENSRADTDSVVESIESAPKSAAKKHREGTKKDNKSVADSNGSVASSSLPSEEFLPAPKSQYPFAPVIQSTFQKPAEGVSRPPTGRKQQPPQEDEIEADRLSPRMADENKYPAELISPLTSATRKNTVPSFLAMSMSPPRVQSDAKVSGRGGKGSSVLLSLNRPNNAHARDQPQQVMEMVPASFGRKKSALHEDSPTIVPSSSSRSSAAKAAPASSSSANRMTRSDITAFLFQNYNFLVSGFTEKKRELVEGTIKKHAGRVISKVPADYQELNTLSQLGAAEHGRVILISHPTEFRKPKFIQALIAGVVILHYNWVTDSIARGELAPIRNYLLPSGYSALHSHYIFSTRYRPLLSFTQSSSNMPLFVRGCTIFQNMKLMNLTGLKIWDDMFQSLGATVVSADQDTYRNLLSMEAGDFFMRSSHGSVSSSSSNGGGGKRRMNQNKHSGGEDSIVDYILFDPAIFARSHAFYTSKALQRMVGTQNKTAGSHSKKDSMISETELQVLSYCQHLSKEVDEQQQRAVSRPPQVASIDWLLHCIFLDAMVDVNSLDLFQLPTENTTSSMTYKADLEWIPPANSMNDLILHERYSKYDLIYFAKDMHSRTSRPSIGIGKIVAISRRNLESAPSIRIMPLSVERAVSDDGGSEHLQLVSPEEKVYTLLTPSQVRGKVILITRHLAPLLTGYIKHAEEIIEQGPEDHVYITSHSYEDEWPLRPWQNSQLQDSQHQNSVDERRMQAAAQEQGRPFKRLKFASQDV